MIENEGNAAALLGEVKKLKADNAFLAEELCSTAQQVVQLHAELQKARLEKSGKAKTEKSGKVDFGSPGAYVSNLNRQQAQTTVQELKPVLRRYNFELVSMDAHGKKDNGKEAERRLFEPKYKVRTSFSCLDKSAISAFPAPIGTEAAARGNHEDRGACAPSIGYYEVVLPPQLDPPTRSKKLDFLRFSYTDWGLRNLSEAKPGTTLDMGSIITWIAEAEPRTPDDALPLLTICKDALKNIASGQLDVRTKTEIDLEKQLNKVTEQRDEAQKRGDVLHAQCEHLQKMIVIFEQQTEDMQKRIDVFAADTKSKTLQAQLDIEVVKSKQLGTEVTTLKATTGKLKEEIKVLEAKLQQTIQDNAKALSVPLSEKILAMNEDELLQHVLFIFKNPVQWDRIGPEILAADTDLALQLKFCKMMIHRLRERTQSWVADLCALLDEDPKDLPSNLTKWYEKEDILKLTPALSKEVKDLARNVRKKEFQMTWDVMRKAFDAGSISLESAIFHISGKSKDEILTSWTGTEAAELQMLLDARVDFKRWIARKDVNAWRQERRYDRLKHLGFLDFSTVSRCDAQPPPTAVLNLIILSIFKLKLQWDAARKDAGRPPLNLMRVTRAYFFYTYGIRSAAERHLAEFLAGLMLHQVRMTRTEARKQVQSQLGTQGQKDKDEKDENCCISYRALLFSSLLRMDDVSQWRDQTTQVILKFIIGIRDVVVPLRSQLRKRTGEVNIDEEEDATSLKAVFSDCDFLCPATCIVPIIQSPEIVAIFGKNTDGINISQPLKMSAESSVPKLERQQSMRAQVQKKTLMTDAEQAAFDEAEEKRVETHQVALKYVLASGDTGCVWIDRFLYLLAEHISKTNAAMEAKLKSTFAQHAQDAEGRMDLGDFASMLKTLDPEMGEMDVAHLFMELVDSKGCIDVDEWLQLLSLYHAGLAGGGSFLPDEPMTFLDHTPPPPKQESPPTDPPHEHHAAPTHRMTTPAHL